MSWVIHWQIPFAGLEGGQYRVNILEDGYSGSIVTLTGGAQPFVTQENSNDDVFTPLRGQSGYIRIVTNDLSLMEQIMPANNTEKLVELRYGVNDTLMWRGFLQSQAFSQPWDNNLRQLEFPINSVLSALEGVEMNESLSAERGQLWPVLVNAMNALGVEPSQVVIATAESTIGSFMQHYVKYGLFFAPEDIDNQGDTVTEQISNSFYDILTSIASLHGVVLREAGGTLYIMDYLSKPSATAGNVKIATFTWSDIANGTYTATSTTEIAASDMLTIIEATMRGKDNAIGYITGRKAVRLTVDLDQDAEDIIALPHTTEDTSTVIEKDVNEADKIYMQVHDPRVSSRETYYFSEYNSNGIRQAAATFAQCLAKSSINFTDSMDEFPAYTGAYPCRWYFKEQDSATQVILVNGLALTLINGRQGDSYSDEYRCYTLVSQYSQRLTGGYLNLTMLMHLFSQSRFDTYEDTIVTMKMVVKFAGYSWDGEAWVAESDGTKQFTITIVNNAIVTNRTDDMNVDADEGYFIPVGDEKYGTLEVTIMDYYSGVYPTIAPMGFILESIALNYYYPSDLSVSQRTSNNYYKSLLRSGFSQERTISTNIGTYNNNLPSMSFLYDANYNYIQTMEYLSEGSTVTQRPELHLLTLMAGYFATIRRTMLQIMKLADLYDRLYSYGGRYYVAIDETHDWRSEQQRVKFIEVR